jgi:hippurate hydrolase
MPAQLNGSHNNFDGSVHFNFQPEESVGGAKAMLQDGLFERLPCDSVFGNVRI